ncbi:hypothetical protein TNCV_550091 [Trichonephila clavipes]|nr:hypothetical protein TNCV_550091 [Trichonephila clavipes]
MEEAVSSHSASEARQLCVSASPSLRFTPSFGWFAAAQTLMSRAAQKMGELVQENWFFWSSTRYLGFSQWVGCHAKETGITHVQVLQQTSQVKHMATLCLFWPVHRTQTDGTHVGHLKHGIGPFLSIAL